jgi:hypothetical protein
MVLAKGSKVIISSSAVSYVGALAEDYTVGLSSTFKPLVDDYSNEVTKIVNALGATLKSLSAGRLGLSSRFKQLNTQIWESTESATISIGVAFDRITNAKEDIAPIVREFCKFPLPGEGLAGNLIPPGPSPIEGVGLDQIWHKGASGVENDDRFINLTIGNMEFNRFLMTKAEPTFSKFSDASGYPISVIIAFEFISMWAATKTMIDDWFK